MHQQKLIALIEAGFALIALFLTWLTATAEGFGTTRSTNGFSSWGLLSLMGIIGIVIACLLGDKTKPFDDQGKKIALASFGLIILGAIIYFIRIKTLGGATQAGYYTINVKTSAGPGLWMALVAGIVGVLFVSGAMQNLATKPVVK